MLPRDDLDALDSAFDARPNFRDRAFDGGLAEHDVLVAVGAPADPDGHARNRQEADSPDHAHAHAQLRAPPLDRRQWPRDLRARCWIAHRVHREEEAARICLDASEPVRSASSGAGLAFPGFVMRPVDHAPTIGRLGAGAFSGRLGPFLLRLGAARSVVGAWSTGRIT